MESISRDTVFRLEKNRKERLEIYTRKKSLRKIKFDFIIFNKFILYKKSFV